MLVTPVRASFSSFYLGAAMLTFPYAVGSLIGCGSTQAEHDRVVAFGRPARWSGGLRDGYRRAASLKKALR